MKQAIPSTVNEHVFELRFKPNARVIDQRGAWAETLAAEMQLSEWNIVNNRVDVFARDQSARAFVGFRNAGVTYRDTPTADLFPDKAIKFLRLLCRLPGFEAKPFVERIGVRSKFGTGTTLTFSDLLTRFTTRYSNPTAGVTAVFGDGSKLIDAGAPLNFTDRLGSANTMCGPMTAEQFVQFFAKDEGFPEVGVYFDIDYWQKPNRAMDEKEVASQLQAFAAESWAMNQRLVSLLLEK